MKNSSECEVNCQLKFHLCLSTWVFIDTLDLISIRFNSVTQSRLIKMISCVNFNNIRHQAILSQEFLKKLIYFSL